MNIRQATIADLPLMYDGAKEFYASSVALRDFHLDRFIASWTGFIESGNGVIFVAEEDGQIDGAIGGYAYQNPYGYEKVVTEFFWFVKMIARGVGLKLYFKFKEWARASGAAEIQMVELLDSMDGRVGEFYRHEGYIEIEKRYLLRLA